MNKNQKKQLLNKLRQISQLNRTHRNSQPVLKQTQNSNNTTNDFNSNTFNIHNLTQDSHISMQHTLSAPRFASSQRSSIIEVDALQEKQFSQNNKCGKFKKIAESSNSPNVNESKTVQQRTERQSVAARVRFGEDPAKLTNQTLSSLLDMQQNSFENVRPKCRQCQKVGKINKLQIDSLNKQIKELRAKLREDQQKIQKLQNGLSPYINNVNLMSAIVDSLQQKQKGDFFITKESQKTEAVCDTVELEEAAKLNKYLLKEGRQKDKQHLNQTYRLKQQIDCFNNENAKLKSALSAKDNRIKLMEQQLRQYENSSSMRQRLDMCRQQLYSYKLKYQERYQQNKQLQRRNEQMKYKINILTSLIGCAIIFDLKEKENDNKYLKQFINKIDKYQNLTHNLLQNNGFYYLKFLQSLHKEEIHSKNQERKSEIRNSIRNSLKPNTSQTETYKQTFLCRKLYLPNFLALLGEQSIAPRSEHIVIKPILFLKIRSILDCKYIDYRINEGSSPQFSDFCNSHLRNYEIQQAQKKLYCVSRQMSENETKQVSMDFMKCLMDQRIQDLPQVQTFRQFMFGKWEEDQIYFYLMCRHKLVEGNELENYINSGDPSKFIRFDKAKRTVLKISQKFGRNIQNFICYHLNERKTTKNNHQLIRLYYLLKLLLLVYRKIRMKKIQQFKELFDNVIRITGQPILNFMHFHEILKKNFQFLSRSHICHIYRTSLAIYESQKNTTQFFQCFFASQGAHLLLCQLIRQDKQLQFDCLNQQEMINFKNNPPPAVKKQNVPICRRVSSTLNQSQIRNSYSHFKQPLKMNQLQQLWPQAVYAFGNQRLNKQYTDLLKSNQERLRTKIQTLSFLTDVSMSHYIKQNMHVRDSQELCWILSESILNIVEYLNKMEKYKLQRQNEMNQASRKLGKFFKGKVYQFYQEMLEDINNIHRKTNNKEVKRNKRYFNEKARASRVFETIKLK